MANFEYTLTKKCIFSDLKKLKVLVGLVDFTSLRTFGHCEPLGLLTYSRLPASITTQTPWIAQAFWTLWTFRTTWTI